MTVPKPPLAGAAPQLRAPRPTTLAGLIGAGCAAALCANLITLEGKKNVGYLDIVGIPTACVGDTKDVIVGKFYTDAECTARLERQAMSHAAEVIQCTPRLRGRDSQLVAAGLLAYNIGGPAYCRSTVDRQFDAGNWRAGCDAFRMWNKAGGKVVRGLVNRREFEITICKKGLPA
jgi:lysozyme